MDVESLVERAVARVEELPGSSLGHPFGDDCDVFTVRGKIFMLIGESAGEVVVTLKSAPGDARALVEGFADITPGYHMDKRHWISLHGGGRLDAQLVDDLVAESYLLVVEKLPKKDRPVDPSTFGQQA